MGQVRDTKFGTNVSNEMLLSAVKCQGYNFDYFGVIRVKLRGEGGKTTPPPADWGLSNSLQQSDGAIF